MTVIWIILIVVIVVGLLIVWKENRVIKIDGIRGFMPDFLLYLKDADFTYQVFLEPKGDNLREKDQWKQDFLMSLSARPDVEVLSENEKVRLIGIKFYSSDRELKQAFREDFKEKLIDDEELEQLRLSVQIDADFI